MFRCEEYGRKEVFVRPDEFQLDRGLLQKHQETITLDVIKHKFKCRK